MASSNHTIRIFLIMSCGYLIGNLCGPARAQDVDRESDPSVVLEVPSDEQLESQHARIGTIVIKVDDIFENETRKNFYHVINSLHISTRKKTVADQLLFHSGDSYQRRLLDETERLLREQRYLNAASIRPLAYHADNTVDLIVRIHDVWTFQPGFSFARKGGANSSRAELEETNLLGFGKKIAFQSANNPDRSEVRVAYVDPNVLATHWQMSASYAQLSDGRDSQFSLVRPFYSLDDHWSFELTGGDTSNAVALFSLGEVADQFVVHRQGFGVGGGWSAGAQDDHSMRYLGGLRYRSWAFAPLPETVALPNDRMLAYPWVGVERVQDAYIKTRNFDQMDRTEDINLGTVVHAELGLASTAFGGTSNALLLNASLQSGAELATGQHVLGSIAFDGRFEDDQLRSTTINAVARYYRRQSEHRLLFTSLQLTRAIHLDGDEQLLLGGDNGLRGYPMRFQAGNALALATIEERFYTNWQPLKLFNVGAAIFADAGRTWGDDPTAGAPLGWLADAGIGLRIGSARSHHGNVLHIDVAFPMNLGRDIDDSRVSGVQLLIETRSSF